ncbi:cysteine-rich protein 2-binding protein-like [Uloborus diversus]|uniref:cysteine-rich protein 2-binding protein-like n=1 Tax=Uloborus diversus TaxID=327109 RepID=UPI00240997A5|nr:cysteine-rich protein 2-binding protein-like [Uloborus diversus]
MESQEQTSISFECYCSTTAYDPHMLLCSACKKRFHPACLKSGRPSDLIGDIYFKFTCSNCSPDGVEIVKRMKLQWTLVIILTLYNLQLQGGGKCGYFRWREHICRFIDKHWTLLFGTDRKKSATWHGTVAGCLSTGANRFFVSGVELLKETGWWALKSSQLPSLEELDSVIVNIKPSRKRKTAEMIDSSPIIEGTRKKNSNVVEAAVALKEKKICLMDTPKPSKPKKKRESKSKDKHFIFPKNHSIKLIVPKSEFSDSYESFGEGSSRQGIPKIIIKSGRAISPTFTDDAVSQWIKEEPKDEIDLENMAGTFDFPHPLQTSNTLNSLLDDVLSEISCDKTSLKSPQGYESEEENSNSCKTIGMVKKNQHPDTSRKRKAVTKDENPVKDTVVSDPKYTLMCPYEEEQLLLKLESYPKTMKERLDVRRLYRKLIVRKLKRERNLPVFDIDAEVRAIRGMDPPDYVKIDDMKKSAPNLKTVLDRYQVVLCKGRSKMQQHTSFVTRLMGLEDEQQDCIISPYTERVLQPFIFRDFKTKPLKLQVLEELLSHKKFNSVLKPPEQNSIDYCYVRPQHIPAINALCHNFFWPGIDMSESLQYPDFSCVALYKKVIIGFAFMYPDVKCNEAYISFIFCHPEWRKAGIATFMLYHLMQTCLGKDITLHVSATSSAVFFYEKFGFKVEEFVHDFYEKYLPPDSKECRHALFLRLSR